MAWNSKLQINGMPFVSVGQVAHGFIAIGQIARGIFTLGQVSIGVVSIGQLGIGVISFNQAGFAMIDFSANLGLGVVTFALAGVGILFSYCMAGIGFISNHIGYYHISYGTPESEANTFWEALSIIFNDIAYNPQILIIYATVWLFLFYIAYKKIIASIHKQKR